MAKRRKTKGMKVDWGTVAIGGGAILVAAWAYGRARRSGGTLLPASTTTPSDGAAPSISLPPSGILPGDAVYPRTPDMPNPIAGEPIADPIIDSRQTFENLEVASILPELAEVAPNFAEKVASKWKYDCKKMRRMRNVYRDLTKKDKKMETVRRAQIMADYLTAVMKVRGC